MSRRARIFVTVLWVVVFIAALAFYTAHSGTGNIWNTDDALYAHVVRTIIETGDINATWYDYPITNAYPLGIRVMALVSYFSGTDEFGLRLSNLLCCLGVLLVLMFFFPREGLGDRARYYAVALLAAQPLFFWVSQRVLHDGLLCLMITAAIASYLRGIKPGAHWGWILAAGLLCGLTSLVKVFAGLLPIAIICLDVVLAERRLLKKPAAWFGLATAIALPAALLASHLVAIARALVGRFFMGIPGFENQHQDRSYTFGTILDQEGIAGIVILGLGAIALGYALWKRTPTQRVLVIWTCAASALLIVARTRLPSYSLLLLIPGAYLCGDLLAMVESRLRVIRVIGPALCLVLLVQTAHHGSWVHNENDPVADFGRMQAEAPEDALLCTIDIFHASAVYYSGRKVLYFSESERAISIMRRTYGEETVPTLGPGELVRRLNEAPHFSCIVHGERWPLYSAQVPGVEVIAPAPGSTEYPVVLVRR